MHAGLVEHAVEGTGAWLRVRPLSLDYIESRRIIVERRGGQMKFAPGGELAPHEASTCNTSPQISLPFQAAIRGFDSPTPLFSYVVSMACACRLFAGANSEANFAGSRSPSHGQAPRRSTPQGEWACAERRPFRARGRRRQCKNRMRALTASARW